MDNYFNTLNKVNVNDHTEQKNGLTYLSWAWAWGELKKIFPDATYTVYEDANGCFYHTDGKTCWVKTGVTVNGIEHIEYLPVMNFKNQSIPLNAVTSFDVNKAIQRSLTKAVARHGLGLYIYAGEDLPEDETEVKNEKGKYGKNNDETVEDAKANREMEESVDKDLLPTRDGVVTKSQIEKLKAQMERTAIDEVQLCDMFKKSNIMELTQAQVINAINGLMKKEDNAYCVKG